MPTVVHVMVIAQISHATHIFYNGQHQPDQPFKFEKGTLHIFHYEPLDNDINQKLKHFNLMDNNCHKPDLVQAFPGVEKGGLKLKACNTTSVISY